MDASLAANLRKAQQHRKRAKELEEKAREQNDLADEALAAALNPKVTNPTSVSAQMPQTRKGPPPRYLTPFDANRPR